MKLIVCKNCQDIVRLWPEFRTCLCGASGGRYIDEINVLLTGEALPIGFANPSYYDAVRAYFSERTRPLGFEFVAFIIPDNARSIKRG